MESSKASELVSRRFSTERLRQSLKVKSRKSTARKSKRADFHSAEKNNPVNCFSRGGECERSERRPEVTKTKVSANVVKRTTCFCEGNPRERIFGRVELKKHNVILKAAPEESVSTISYKYHAQKMLKRVQHDILLSP